MYTEDMQTEATVQVGAVILENNSEMETKSKYWFSYLN